MKHYSSSLALVTIIFVLLGCEQNGTSPAENGIVTTENPLDDILNTLSLKYTVQGGVIYDSEMITKFDLRGLGGQ